MDRGLTYKQVSVICPQPYPPTETTELDAKACLSFTEQGALREIAKINVECKQLSQEIRPVRAFLESAYQRLAALNKQRHTLDLFIFEDKLRKLPRGFSGLGAGLSINSKEDFIDWFETLSPAEVASFQNYYSDDLRTEEEL